MNNYCLVLLTCESTVEADTIAKALLEKQLIACAKQTPVSSDFLWQGKTENNSEVLLIMDSREDLFDEIETVVKNFHSYETFVLQLVPIGKISRSAIKWLDEVLKKQ